MPRLSSSLFLFFLAFCSLQVAGCEEPGVCAYGPSEIRDESLTASVGAPIGGFIAFGDIDGSAFTVVSSDDAPAGVELSLEDGGVAVDGSVAEPGTYTFVALVQAEEGDACSEWARYDVTLTVE